MLTRGGIRLFIIVCTGIVTFLCLLRVIEAVKRNHLIKKDKLEGYSSINKKRTALHICYFIIIVGIIMIYLGTTFLS